MYRQATTTGGRAGQRTTAPAVRVLAALGPRQPRTGSARRPALSVCAGTRRLPGGQAGGRRCDADGALAHGCHPLQAGPSAPSAHGAFGAGDGPGRWLVRRAGGPQLQSLRAPPLSGERGAAVAQRCALRPARGPLLQRAAARQGTRQRHLHACGQSPDTRRPKAASPLHAGTCCASSRFCGAARRSSRSGRATKNARSFRAGRSGARTGEVACSSEQRGSDGARASLR